jgi:tetratricopeptide (TPR) repeat protein
MNKSILILVLIFLTIGSRGKAQTSVTGTPTANYSGIESKLKKSDATLSDSVKTSKPKFWIARAESLMDAFEVNRKYLSPGVTQKVLLEPLFQKPKDTKAWQDKGANYEEYIYERINVILKDGVVESYEETKPLYKDPVPNALTALQTAQKLDVENKSKKDLKEDYTKLSKDFNTLGIEQFGKKEYEAAFNAFASISVINAQPVMGGYIDTFSLYNAGLSAYNAKKFDETINFLERAKAVNHPEPNLYVLLEQSYCHQGDSAKGISTLEEGFKRFPNSDLVQIELINYFLSKNESEKALNYLKMAQQADPKNMSFIFVEGTLYDKMGDTEKAVETYNRCVELDPNFFDAYYNIGVVYYNKAVKLTEEASKIDIKNQKAYEEKKAEADEEFKKAIPYMEKAHGINPAETSTMQILKNLYKRLQMTEKYDAILLEIQGQQQ